MDLSLSIITAKNILGLFLMLCVGIVGAKIPYIDWRYSSSNNFSADNKTFCEVYEVSAEFYSGEKDITTEGLIKSVLKDNDIPFAHGEIYLDDERVYIETYNFSVIDQ